MRRLERPIFCHLLTLILLSGSGVSAAADFTINATSVSDAQTQLQERFRILGQKVANQAPFLWAIKNEVDPDIKLSEFQARWDAARTGQRFAASQGTMIHAIMARLLHGKTVSVNILGQTETWRIWCEVQFLEKPWPWQDVGQVMGLGFDGVDAARRSGVKAADLIFLKDDCQITLGTNLRDFMASWRGGLDYKCVFNPKGQPQVEPRLAAVLEKCLPKTFAEQYKFVKIVQRSILVALDRPYITKLLQLRGGHTLTWCKDKALNVASGGTKGMFKALGIIGLTLAIADTAEGADKITNAALNVVRRAHSAAAPYSKDSQELSLLIVQLWGTQTALPSAQAIDNAILGAMYTMHDAYINNEVEVPGIPNLSDYPNGTPFVEVNGEIYPQFGEPQQ